MTQKHPEYNGPAMGPKMATENKRGFTEEDNRKMRDGSIGLQVNQKLTSVTFDFKIYILSTVYLIIYSSYFFLRPVRTKEQLKLVTAAWEILGTCDQKQMIKLHFYF